MEDVVDQAECYKAFDMLLATDGATMWKETYVGSWNWLPHGCVIYIYNKVYVDIGIRILMVEWIPIMSCKIPR